MTKLAPIVLFTYNRLWHTQQTVEALQKNELASESELFIFSDGPKDEEQNKTVTEVRNYIKTINGFKKITIYESFENKGLANSIIDGVTKVVNEFGKVIVLEDDIVASHGFLRYMNNAPLFSVLISNHNNGRFLEECLQSIFSQTYTNWEVIIVDDASTDNSKNIYLKFAQHPKIKIFYNRKNKGVGFTKDACIRLSRGEIAGFVDPDDTLSTDAIELLVGEHLKNPGHSIIYSTHYICDEKLNIILPADYVGQIPAKKKSWTLGLPTISHFATFKRKNYLKTKGISPFFKKAADKDLYYKLEETGPVLFIDKPLYYYRKHKGSISLNEGSKIAFQYEQTARAMAVLRNNYIQNAPKQLPYSEISILDGIKSVRRISLENKDFGIALYLTLLSFRFEYRNSRLLKKLRIKL